MFLIRHEDPGDSAAIRQVLELAFGQRMEADLVDALRQRGKVTLSLVAIQDQRAVGQILFSPMIIESDNPDISAIGLGPMAILPSYQGKGIGSQLVRIGLEECRGAGHEIVMVLGHPHFYQRFGFVAAKTFGIRSEFDVPDDVFMILELHPGAWVGRGGVAKYQPEFNLA